MLDLKRVFASGPKKPVDVELKELLTPWGEELVKSGVTRNKKASGNDALIHKNQRGLNEQWGSELGKGVSKHPHPQFARESFNLLDGWWEYCIVNTDEAETAYYTAPLPKAWEGRIRVPFSPEAPLSGVNRQLKPNELLWYRKAFTYPLNAPLAQERCILHFEAVDYACAVYCNGVQVGTHRGGYLPFAFDITDALTEGTNELAVCVYDPSDAGVQLRGKQRLERGGIWYTAQSGIWQSVWLEVVPKQHIRSLSIDANPAAESLTLEVAVSAIEGVRVGLLEQDEGKTGTPNSMHVIPNPINVIPNPINVIPGLTRDLSENSEGEFSGLPIRSAMTEGESSQIPLSVQLLDGGELVAMATASPSESQATQGLFTLKLKVPKPHLWSPDDPHLYHLELTYGEDKVQSYCAFRTISMQEDAQGIMRLHVNHTPCFLRGVLDQGYWPDGLLTAPSDEALIFDIQTMKDLGFNMLRKHIKIEGDRWYYHCDRLGMLVWQDMVSGGTPPKPWYSSYMPTFFRWSWGAYTDGPRHYRNLAAESADFRAEWTKTCVDTVAYLGNHPSIITWVLFNEAWGQFDARAATHMVQKLDPTRPIDAVSGWYDQACGDFLSVHNYFRPLEVYKDTAGRTGATERSDSEEHKGATQSKRAFVISEFGGLSYHLPEHSSLATSYGYETFESAEAYLRAAKEILAQADALEQQGLAGFVYTQLSDVEEETNGLLTYDRRVNKLGESDDKDEM